jgi:hypothetical protein
MKTLLIINIHSLADVITNSSTDLFVCDTDKTIKMVKEILEADPNFYGYQEPWIFNLKEFREWRNAQRSLKEGEPIDYDNKFRYIDGWFHDIEDEEDLKELRKEFIENGDNSGGYWSSDRNPFSDRLYEAQRKVEKSHPGDYHYQYEAKKAEIEKIYNEVETQDEKPDWWVNPTKYHYNDQPLNDLDGKIIIVGEEDNSMPFDHFDWIENVFNAKRHHLG